MRPKLHFTPQKNWMNDPNGLIYFNDTYHIFYQYFPKGLEWGTMHWGHATTKDFINYEYHKIALNPSINADINGCFSGSGIVIDNKLYLYYTGVKYIECDPNNPDIPLIDENNQPFEARQLMVTSNDGFSFSNKNIVVDMLPSNIGCFAHTRDPKVWIHNNIMYMVLVTKYNNNGKLLLYKSTDYLNFELITSFSDEGNGNMWECPDYFEIDNQGILIISFENIVNDGSTYVNQAVIAETFFNYDKEEFKVNSSYKYLDEGLDIYAPQTFLDKDDNRVLISWIRMKKPHEDGFIGMFTMPRIITFDNKLKYQVHPNVYNAFKSTDKICPITDCARIEFTLPKNGASCIGGVNFEYNDKLIIDRSLVVSENDILNKVEIELDRCNLEVYIDINVIEIFINEGEHVVTWYIDKFENKLQVENATLSTYQGGSDD